MKDQKRDGEGEAERDWKIMLSTIQVKYPTEFVIEMSLSFTRIRYCE